MLKVDQVYAFISHGEEGEGIIGQTVPIAGQMVFMPFVCADKARMESLKPMAEEIHRRTGQKIKIIKLTNRKEIGRIG